MKNLLIFLLVIMSAKDVFSQDSVNVTFRVDMSVKIREFAFNPDTSVVKCVGTVHTPNWSPLQTPNMDDSDQDSMYSITYKLEANKADYLYKFVIDENGWETAYSGERQLRTTNSDTILPIVFYDNDTTISVYSYKFNVNMAGAFWNKRFTPGDDDVHLMGLMRDQGGSNMDYPTIPQCDWSVGIKMERINNYDYYKIIGIPDSILGDTLQFKFRIIYDGDTNDHSGWEQVNISQNRVVFLTAAEDSVLPTYHFEDWSNYDLVATNPDTIDFGKVQIGQEAVDTLSIYNLGATDSVKISDLSTLDDDFSFPVISEYLGTNENIDIPIYFRPSTIRNYQDELIYSVNDSIYSWSWIHLMGMGDSYEVIYDFESPIIMDNNIQILRWGLGLNHIEQIDDPTSRSSGVCSLDFDLQPSQANNTEWGLVEFIRMTDLGWTALDTGITHIKMDIWLPGDAPNLDIGMQIQFDYNTKTYVENFSTDGMNLEDWNTIELNVLNPVISEQLDPHADIRLILWIRSTAVDWMGSIFIDNIKLRGVESPLGELQIPSAHVEIDTTNEVLITWDDNEELFFETYNIYRSDQIITDVSSPNVIKIADKIGRKINKWYHQAYSDNRKTEDLYFAITANLDSLETSIQTEINSLGPISHNSFETAKAVYDLTFSDNFNLDGDISEFKEYSQYVLKPHSAWIPLDSLSDDINFEINFVADNQYLYFAAHILDEDPSGSMDAIWQGDGMELFMGFYDASVLTNWHSRGSVFVDSIDKRISFAPDGRGYSDGIDYVFNVVSDGYFLEAKFDIDVLSNNQLNIKKNQLLPLYIGVTDRDPIDSEDFRSNTLYWGVNDQNDKFWLRPGSWGFLQIYEHKEVGFETITQGDIVNNPGSSMGCCWGDYDNDGDLDLFVANHFEEDNFLYKNLLIETSSANFERITSGIIVTDGGNSSGCSWADFDNDGYLDLFVADIDIATPNRIYRNLGNGDFEKLIIDDIENDNTASNSVSWGDYENDGDLDLFVANVHEGENNSLYRNMLIETDSFSLKKIDNVPPVNDGGTSGGCGWGDYDNDRDLDLVVTNWIGENNFFYENLGSGNFNKVTYGSVPNDSGNSGGVSWADFNNDGYLDLFITNAENEMNPDEDNVLYLNTGNKTLLKMDEGSIVNDGGNSSSSAWGDMDNDGDLDLVVTNWGPSTNFLYSNENDGTFNKITNLDLVLDTVNTVGCAWADYDNDGDLDLFVTNGGGNNHLYKNISSFNNWINIKAVGKLSNHSAIGAKIKLLSQINGKPVWQMCQISSQTGGFSQNSLNAEFGLGYSTSIDSIIIEWPSGIIWDTTNVLANQFLKIEEKVRNDVYLDAKNEYSDSIKINYNINTPTAELINLNCMYSVDNGSSYFLASIIGDTTDLPPKNNIGSLIWDSYSDVPGIDVSSALFKILAYNQSSTFSTLSTEIFHLDNNRIPHITIFPIVDEKKNDIQIQYQLNDQEGDILSLLCEFLDPNLKIWKVAHMVGNDSILTDYNNEMIWQSAIDIPDTFGFFDFRITPYDNDPGIPDTITIKIDQIGVCEAIAISQFVDEQSGDIPIEYTLADDEEDPIDLTCEYSDDSGLTWNLATVSGSTSNISSVNYSGSLTWHSATDLPGEDRSGIRFKITPNDGYEGFPIETEEFHVDNNLPPAITLNDLSAIENGVVKIPVQLSDTEQDSLQILFAYNLDGGNWIDSDLFAGQYFTFEEYPDTIYWNSSANLGFGEFPSVQVRLIPTDYDSGTAVLSNTFKIYNYAGDYSGDVLINYDDLLVFTNAWWTQDLNKEIGPAIGEPPLLIPQPDGVIDFEDLMVLAQQWNWSFDHPNISKKTLAKLLTKETLPTSTLKITELDDQLIFERNCDLSNYEYDKDEFKANIISVTQSTFNPWSDLFGDEVIISFDSTLNCAGFEFCIEYDPIYLQIEELDNLFLNTLSGFTFKGHDQINGRILINSFRFEDIELLNYDKQELLNIKLKYLQETDIPLNIFWQTHSRSGQLISSGSKKISIEGHTEVPEKFALLQNYPNPFNSSTTIRYQLPTTSKVKIELFNTLGQKIQTLMNSTSSAGYYNLRWNLSNKTDPASSIYFIRMYAKSENGKRFTKVIKTLVIK